MGLSVSVSDPGTALRLAELRAVATPANLALVGILGLAWVALIGWTGAGPDGWQVRSCAGLAVRPAACQGVPPAKDASRIVPHVLAASLAR
ncbi:hypothetical protein FV232_21480 [Methylobacterium sp. WL30]|nr:MULTISPECIES: hypothetical protein [unclassified Methylobacterium]TXN33327.1 hypothetical protein FV225_18950 [Methylobacterium sp. WL93]TXN46494.1 hypothetical protein FV227_23415 [Methylobacterium sp. WL119]TXN64184.1 hypothetical protein FV232_21480 [Methylobacterium sp. WL30]